MPKIERIPADAEPPETLSEKDLEKEIKRAQKTVDTVRKTRGEIRATTPKPQLLEALAETGDELAAAVDHLNRLERALGRARRTGRGQTVAVGTAASREKAAS